MPFEFDDTEIEGVIDSNLKDSPPNPPRVNTASIIRTMLKGMWVAIRTQVQLALDYVELTNSDTYIQQSIATAQEQVTLANAQRVLAETAKTQTESIKAQLEQDVLDASLYKGTWNAATNSPALTTSPLANGSYYQVIAPGTQSVTGGSISYEIGDYLKSNGTAWERIPKSSPALAKVLAIEAKLIIDESGNLNVIDPAGNIGFQITPAGLVRLGAMEVNGVLIDFNDLVRSADIATLEKITADVTGIISLLGKSDGKYVFSVTDENTYINIALTLLGELILKQISAQQITTKTLNVTEGITLPVGTTLGNRAGIRLAFGMPTDLLGVESYGQSNSVKGGSGGVSVTTVQKYDALMPSGGLTVGVGGNYTSLVPLVEQSGETPVSGALEAFTETIERNNYLSYTKKGFRFLGGAPGEGSQTVAALSKGGSFYARFIEHVTQAKRLAGESNLTYSVPFSFFIQGETDVVNSTAYQTYYDAVVQLVEDLNTDILAITEQPNKFPLIGYQLASYGENNIYKAHLALGLNYWGYILATPTYHFDFADTVHFTNTYHRIHGAYLAQAAYYTLIEGKKFLPLHPVSFFVDGNSLEISYHVPVGKLVLDTTDVSDPGNFGFRVKSSGGTELTVSNVRIIGANRVRLDCSASPAGGTFLYARNDAGGQFTKGSFLRLNSRGCLRDTAGDRVKIDTYPLHNYCVQVSQTIS